MIDFSTQAFVQSTGFQPPHDPFPAIITGWAWPQHGNHSGANAVPIENFPASGTEPDVFDCDTSGLPGADASGFYPAERLPFGAFPFRYMWQATDRPLSSRTLCGLWPKAPNLDWTVWRQAYYAVNVAHHLQDNKLLYPPVPMGMPVIMSWGDISSILRWPFGAIYGFWFQHWTDAWAGTKECPRIDQGPSGGNQVGCCLIFDQFGGQIPGAEFCGTAAECQQFQSPPTFTSLWQGDGADCPGFECVGSSEDPTVCCRDSTGSALDQCLQQSVCEDLILAGVYDTLLGSDVPCNDLFYGEGVACGEDQYGAEPGGTPGQRGHFRVVTADRKYGGCHRANP